MLGIYSLMIWTICHKLISFYRNAVSLHIIFVVTHGEIFSHLGHTGPLTVNKIALPSRYQRIRRHIHAFIGRNTIALRVQRLAAGANMICLSYATDWWAVNGLVIHGESKSQATRESEQLRPCAGGGWTYIFSDTEFHTFFPDMSRYHQTSMLSGLFQTCQAPDPAAEVDPIAHFGHSVAI